MVGQNQIDGTTSFPNMHFLEPLVVMANIKGLLPHLPNAHQVLRVGNNAQVSHRIFIENIENPLFLAPIEVAEVESTSEGMEPEFPREFLADVQLMHSEISIPRLAT